VGWIDVHHHILPPAFADAQREEILAPSASSPLPR
jgi:hypothetical protein